MKAKCCVDVMLGCLLGAVGGLLPAKAPAETSARAPITIEAQPLASALRTFSLQTGLQLIYLTDLTRGRSTQGCAAAAAPDEALTELLAGTGLAFDFLNERTVRIRAQESGTQPKTADRSGVAGNRAAAGGMGGRTSAEAPPELSEVLVTATRRAQNIQDVPLSITAFSADEIDERRLVSEDYLRAVPGVSQLSESDSTAIIIRGIEASPSAQNFGSGPSVATYFGEVSTTFSTGIAGGSNVDLKLVDIDHVEVLRGPQGTSFGDSSLGGAVRTIPAAPKLNEFEAKVAANYSSTSGTGSDNRMWQGALNLPVIPDTLAIRVVGYRFEDSGYYRNVAASDPVFQAAAASYGAQSLAVNEDHVGDTSFTGGRIAALWQAADALKFTLTYLHQTTLVDGGYASSTSSGYDQSLYSIGSPQPLQRGQISGTEDTGIDLINLVGEYNLGWGSLLASFAHIDGTAETSQVATGFLGPLTMPAGEYIRGQHHEYSGELRLTSQPIGPWKFILGLYTNQQKDLGLFDYYWLGSAATNPLGVSAPFLGEDFNHRELKQNAAYGELSYDFLHGFTLTAAARGYRYKRSVQTTESGALFGGDPVAFAETDASGTSGKLNLSYKIDAGAMVYAQWSQGFRLGKPQVELPAAICGANGFVAGTHTPLSDTGVVKSDRVNSYELGMKLTLASRLTIDADIFRVYWSGVPILIYAPPPPAGCGLIYVANAANATSQGVELEAKYNVTPALRLSLGASYIDPVLSTDAPSLDATKGARLPGSPKTTANFSAVYDFDVLGHRTYVRADSFYVGSFYGTLAEDASLKAGGYYHLDASSRIMLRNLGVELFVHNLTNVAQYTWRGSYTLNGPDFGYRPRPRTVGIEFTYNFAASRR